MYMVGHNNTACYVDVVSIEMIKPFVNRIVSICFFE